MSTEMTMPRPGATRGPRTRLAVALAFPLARLRPDRLRRTLAFLARGARPATYDETLAAYDSVVTTSRRCAGWYGCLPRSVSIALLCRTKGTWPTWHAGVRTAPPFAPHAWVEAEGRLVGERGEASEYAPLMTVMTVGGAS
ncbi:lasso peptide biosynthesis B2 protein [Streptomyces sp. VRA16 Mangrove soil]|uniref:lasso peptide biosynthesis B2 protein n=1 Tax=Streptomyces sp. VRA16 Mangrove soil TaxID=2817434 RepID=UPI001A9DC8F8|nr:lasso peptide biosynthesis B2 protein [Streptomyces sp. VRA16 Mangrove soil]MBO1336285.1 lasso peptide biosynthesis B2 protein [Streptomyces sp. VRA16 Mangrove soil]